MGPDKKYKILIVDDDNFLIDMYALKFSQSNFDVDTALGPDIALEKLKGGKTPDILLLDIVMPQMDGFELLEKINQEGLSKSMCVIILSNRGQASDVERGKELGAAGYIVKASATPSEVIEQVLAIVNKKNNGL
ncbi:response regulator [Candidatus Parcubacteria bacterium]|nr:response regulator [Candidatus Parcubacteria bacterium]